MSISLKADPSGTFGEILVNGQVVAKLPVTGNAVIPGLVGTVSQSGGVPTGAVVERGSNANGEYVRFADGTQICHISVAFTSYDISVAVGSLFRSAPISLTLPASFVGSASASFTILGSTGTCWAGTTSIGASTVGGLLFAPTSGSRSESVRAIVVGRWF